jgi:hypothetical protein
MQSSCYKHSKPGFTLFWCGICRSLLHTVGVQLNTCYVHVYAVYIYLELPGLYHVSTVLYCRAFPRRGIVNIIL